MNKWQAITAFTYVADRGGFSAAARKLGMSSSAVTKCIARLEDELGTLLFHRTTRQLALTENGRRFYERCVRLIAEMEEAEASVRQSNEIGKGKVRIVMPFSFGRVTVIPALKAFYAKNPDIVLDISFSDFPVDLIRDSFDLGVLSGDLENSGLVRRVLLRGPIVTVASPRYLEKFGTPESPEDLTDHNCLIGRRGFKWGFRRSGNMFDIAVNGNLWVRSGDALREAAVAGLGVARSTWWLFRNELDAGELVTILDQYAPEGAPVSVVYPDKRHLSKKVEAVIEFLFEATRQTAARSPAVEARKHTPCSAA